MICDTKKPAIRFLQIDAEGFKPPVTTVQLILRRVAVYCTICCCFLFLTFVDLFGSGEVVLKFITKVCSLEVS